MKRFISLLTSVLLASCSTTVPVTASFPQVPAELTTPCPDLLLLDPETRKLSQVVAVVAKNYGQYQECQVKVGAWTDWYNTQKNIFESVK